MTIKTAVTSVETNGASTTPARGSKGRPAIVLKGGVSYKDAKAAAKEAIRTAKRAVADGKALLKATERNVVVANKALASANKALAKIEGAPNPDKAVQKTLVGTAKGDVKIAVTAVKQAEKAVADQGKVVAKLVAAHEKATAGLLAIEAAKLKSLN